jgi:hypothetical protein
VTAARDLAADVAVVLDALADRCERCERDGEWAVATWRSETWAAGERSLCDACAEAAREDDPTATLTEAEAAPALRRLAAGALDAAVAQAVAAERERAAGVCQRRANELAAAALLMLTREGRSEMDGAARGARECAAAIRAGGV